MRFLRRVLGSGHASIMVALAVQKLRLPWSVHSWKWQSCRKASRRMEEEKTVMLKAADRINLIFSIWNYPTKGKLHVFFFPFEVSVDNRSDGSSYAGTTFFNQIIDTVCFSRLYETILYGKPPISRVVEFPELKVRIISGAVVTLSTVTPLK